MASEPEDIIGRLRHAIATASNDDVSPPSSVLRRRHADRIVAMADAADEIQRLRAGIQAMLDGDYPHPRKHRPGNCPHGQPYYEECGLCDEAWLTAVLSGATPNPPPQSRGK